MRPFDLYFIKIIVDNAFMAIRTCIKNFMHIRLGLHPPTGPPIYFNEITVRNAHQKWSLGGAAGINLRAYVIYEYKNDLLRATNCLYIGVSQKPVIRLSKFQKECIPMHKNSHLTHCQT